MVVYLDVIFLENFFMNLIIILTVSICMKLGAKVWRMILAAAFGAIFYILEFFIIWITWFEFLLGAALVVISFVFHGIKAFLKQLCLLYFISFAFGGISFGLMNVLNREGYSIFDGAIVGNFNLSWLIVAVIIGFVLSIIVIRRRAKHVLADVTISVGGREADAKILLDTGNLLKEPYENRPVMIIQKDVASNILDSVIMDRLHDILRGAEVLPIGMFYIPYRSLGKEYGYLLGFKPDFVRLKGDSKKYTNLVIGICEDVICETGAYSGIFGLDTFDGGVCYEYC